MQKFLLHLFRFAGVAYLVYLGVVLALVLVFTNFTEGYHTDKGNFAREYDAAFSKGDAGLLVLGSSRAAASLDSETLSQGLGVTAYNLAFNQASLTYQYHLLKYYLHEAPKKPALVVLDVSWFSFDNRRLSYKEYASYFVFRSPILFYDELLLNKRNQIIGGLVTLGRSLERSGQPYVNFDDGKRKYLNQDSTRVNYVFDPMDEGFTRTFPKGRAGLIEEEQRSFEKMIALLKRHNITPVLFTSPEDERFSRSQQNRHQVYAYLKEQSQGMLWLDYSLGGNRYSKGNETLLRDSHHVYFKEAFTRQFLADFRREVPGE